MKLHYFSALAGAGKTRALAQAAHRLARDGEKVLFVQPSKLLIDNTIRDEIEPLRQDRLFPVADYSVTAIHGDTCNEVVAAIARHVGAKPLGGEILFVTHQAFLRIPFFPDRHRWIVMLDEIPTVDIYEELSVSDTHKMITDVIEIIPQEAAWGRLVERMGSDRASTNPVARSLDAIARNANGDAVLGIFSGLARRIRSPDWRVHALLANYAHLTEARRHRGDGRSRKLISYSLLQPTIFQGFKQTILASALFEESVLYRLWGRIGVEFRAVGPEFTGGLRYQHHGNGHLITIRYLDDADWSKGRRDRVITLDAECSGEDLRPLLVKDRVPAVISQAMGDQPFAWMGNKDLPDDYFGNDRAVRLPNSPYGLNCFQHLHNVVVVSALNPTPAHFRFMRDHGVDARQLRRAHYQSAVYQAAMRISVRDPEDMAPKTITVMDKSTAVWMADLFPGATVQTLGAQIATMAPGKPGRKRIHNSSADRVQASRYRKQRLKAAFKGLAGNNNGVQGGSYGSVFASIYAKQSALPLDAADDDAFIELLREMHRRVIPGKAENFLISPATFNANATGAGTKRGLDNIEYLRGIWLDNDGGDLKPEDFARLFPSLRLAAWNTYSSTLDQVRWRCFIPTSEVVTPVVYRRLIELICQVLRDEGYVSDAEIAGRLGRSGMNWKRHGFDVGKFCPSSLFYAPCQAEERSGSFFKDHQSNARKALDVAAWIDQQMPFIDTGMPVTMTVEADATNFSDNHDSASNDNQDDNHMSRRITAAISEWRASRAGGGHRALFMLGLELERAGMSLNEIERRLRSELAYACSSRDRLSDIPDILARLARNRSMALNNEVQPPKVAAC